MVDMKRFPDAAALAEGLADEVAARLARAYAVNEQATLVVSGGHSPSGFFAALSARPLEWSRITVTLADERWVEPTDPGSNERLVRATLLQGAAAAAPFIGLKNAAPSAQAGAALAWRRLSALPRPFDVTILGMGADGHTASLIPGSPGLPQALDAHAPAGCVEMRSPVPPRDRLSLNLPALLDSRYLGILLIGEAKLGVYQRACTGGPTEAMPVSAVLRQRQVPVEIHWAPGEA